MLDDKGFQNLFSQLHRIWIEPELAKRRALGQLASDFKIRRCLIKLPDNALPVVEFNGEISWIAKFKKPVGISFEKYDPVFLHQVQYIESVDPPTVENKRVPFFYLSCTGTYWQVIFDSKPSSEVNPSVYGESEDWGLGREIAELLNEDLRELAVREQISVEKSVEDIGLWAVPSLSPYPLSAIVEKVKNGKPDDARELLIRFCGIDFLHDLIQKWHSVDAFLNRKQLFQDAFESHSNGRYALTISALVPHFEGVITDWIESKLSDSDKVPYGHNSKFKKLNQLLSRGLMQSYTSARVAASGLNFIVNGPVWKKFNDWVAPAPSVFPNRHVVGHGKYDPLMYTQENSIKVFLFLDTLFQIMNEHVDQK